MIRLPLAACRLPLVQELRDLAWHVQDVRTRAADEIERLASEVQRLQRQYDAEVTVSGMRLREIDTLRAALAEAEAIAADRLTTLGKVTEARNTYVRMDQITREALGITDGAGTVETIQALRLKAAEHDALVAALDRYCDRQAAKRADKL